MLAHSLWLASLSESVNGFLWAAGWSERWSETARCPRPSSFWSKPVQLCVWSRAARFTAAKLSASSSRPLQRLLSNWGRAACPQGKQEPHTLVPTSFFPIQMSKFLVNISIFWLDNSKLMFLLYYQKYRFKYVRCKILSRYRASKHKQTLEECQL